jgi:hypothetical protein
VLGTLEECFHPGGIVFVRGTGWALWVAFCGRGLVEMNPPIVEIYPSELVIIPLNVFVFVAACASMDVQSLDMIVIGECPFEIVVYDGFFTVEISPRMSGATRPEGLIEPMGKDVMSTVIWGEVGVLELNEEMVSLLVCKLKPSGITLKSICPSAHALMVTE